MKPGKFALFILLIFLFGINQSGKSQDAIVMNSGEKINTDTIIVGDQEIEFQQKGRDSGTHDIVNISDIFMIKYRNGTTDTISTHRPKADTSRNSYFKGIEGADENYTGKKSGIIIFAATLIVSPVLTLYPTIVCAKKSPSIKHLNIHDTTLLNNAQYMKGYKDEASDTKSRKVWKNYVLAGVIWAAVVLFRVF